MALRLLCIGFALAEVTLAADVFAHFMVQNAFAYDVQQWKTDMASAYQAGIDGFALNWIPPNCDDGLEWTVNAIDNAFSAAEAMSFKLVHSFDMSYSSCTTYWNVSFMETILSRHAHGSAAYRWNGDLLVTTYGGDQVSQYGNSFFQALKDELKAKNNAITLVPALTTYSLSAQTDVKGATGKLMSDYSAINGFFNWQAWPLNTDKEMTVSVDVALQSALKSNGKTGPYIMAVSPWQYKDLNNGNPVDAWVAYSDTLLVDRFESLTSKKSMHPDIIELLTWNDFAESHYLRDLPSRRVSAKDFIELGDMAAYILGQDHAPWRIIAKYYISWWKHGRPPAITMDQVVFWHRVHPKRSICAGGSSTGVRNFLFPEDAVFAWALVKEKSTISMSVGSNKYWTFEANGSGPATGMVPFPSAGLESGVTPEVAIIRNGETVHVAKSSTPISSACWWQNFNPVVNLVGEGINRKR